jgi:hydroxymethylpyrimidine kinase/phosphomethylpyrimidine kinase
MPDNAPHPPRILTIAGSDSGGGAGIQADIKVITCLGGYGMSAITALTAQDTRGVWGIHPVPPEFVAQQVELCLADIGVDAVKTGMLCNEEIVRAVAQVLRQGKAPNLVVDPVMFSKSGHRLLDEPAERALIEAVLPLAEVVTPNLPEASRLAGFEVADAEGMRRAAKAILALGPRAVVVKGGHLPGVAADLLFDGREFQTFPAERIDTKNTHGTGCSYSAALATALGRGLPLAEAVALAKKFITEAIRHSLPFGHGCGPTDPLAAARAIASGPAGTSETTRPPTAC